MSVTFSPCPWVRNPPGHPLVGPRRVLHDVDESKKLLEKAEACPVAKATSEGSDVSGWGADPGSHANGYCNNDNRRNYREHKTLLCGAKIHSSDALTVSNVTTRVTLLPICDA